MASVNKVILLGNLGADPELRSTQSGQSVCTLRLATNEHWVGKDGQKQERTEWHRVIFWARLADTISKFVKKGDALYIEGKITTRQWQDKDNVTRYTTEIIGDKFEFVGGKKTEMSSSYEYNEPSYGQPYAAEGGSAQGGASKQFGSSNSSDTQGMGNNGFDDVPF